MHRQGRTIASSSWCPSRRPTSTHRLTSRLRHLGWTGGFAISSSTYSGHFGVTSRPAPSCSLGRGLCLGESTFTSIAMPSFYRPSGNGCAERVPILGITFLRIATTNKPGAINPSIFCLFGFIFPNELLLWFVHHTYTGLSNGGRINDSRMVVRSVSVHSPANAASGTRTDL